MNATFFRFLGAVAVVSAVLSAPAEANAPAGRYTAADGTVTDTKTKLTWQYTAAPATYAWVAAKTYCKNVGTGWRLPTIKELLTLVDFSRSNPAIDPAAFPPPTFAIFWSSSPVPGSVPGAPPYYAWAVGFNYGNAADLYVSSSYAVRCVR